MRLAYMREKDKRYATLQMRTRTGVSKYALEKRATKRDEGTLKSKVIMAVEHHVVANMS